VVQATGHSGEKSFPSHISGINDFKGDVLCHSSEFQGAKPNSKGKRAIVVGCGNSGHDIAQDFYENGYDITIVQRSSTCVLTSEAGLEVLLGGLYQEGGVHQPQLSLSHMLIFPRNSLLLKMPTSCSRPFPMQS
jgi:cation diffusion facilitator CzcD-associated flavoprotein CzcO